MSFIERYSGSQINQIIENSRIKAIENMKNGQCELAKSNLAVIFFAAYGDSELHTPEYNKNRDKFVSEEFEKMKKKLQIFD